MDEVYRLYKFYWNPAVKTKKIIKMNSDLSDSFKCINSLDELFEKSVEESLKIYERRELRDGLNVDACSIFSFRGTIVINTSRGFSPDYQTLLISKWPTNIRIQNICKKFYPNKAEVYTRAKEGMSKLIKLLLGSECEENKASFEI